MNLQIQQYVKQISQDAVDVVQESTIADTGNFLVVYHVNKFDEDQLEGEAYTDIDMAQKDAKIRTTRTGLPAYIVKVLAVQFPPGKRP